MRETKKVTLSAIVVALGTVIILLGAMASVVDLTVMALASLLIVFVYIEIGSPYTWLVWLATSLMVFLFVRSSNIALPLEYFLAFGLYPILKAYIEKLPRKTWLLLKLPYVNLVIFLVMLAMHLLGLPIFELGGILENIPIGWFYAALVIVLNIGFIAYDMFLTVMVRIYFAKLRHRFRHLFK